MRYIVVLLFLSISTLLNSQILVPKKDYVPEIRKARYSFTISLISAGYSSMVSYGIMRENPDSTQEVIFLRKDTFIRQISGYEKSKANPDKINYLEEYKIPSYVFDDIWKVKYDKNPFSVREELGWANAKGKPSEGQFQMLSEFGITKIADYCYGENLFRFLIKLGDPTWVGQYQNR